ncbi:glycosyltransferase [Mucilaginibacter sp. L3T2-6]|uniref:glycosyltransferase n=1 Tax=Mucilaginibacter sp. L3T2-6 TaxID=3062491 RepID=UPI002674A37D|nr:glycosyltransferase [Mucilaginibacter sp. L3T2-6]MDO3642236.1 glycosyltransferase [Mucilaginibacter sp. L3T2-6]MDV6214731.1 glycosyltransferase [Mucilaginibacter sp. L3T2-6]
MGESKNVLYLSYDGMTDPLGQSQVIPYLSGLSKSGFSFTILSFEKKYRYKKNGSNIKTILDAAGIYWHPLIYTKSPPVLSTLYDYLRMIRTAINLHRKLNYKLVHCRSYIPALVGMALNRKYKLPFIFDMRGFWADERVDGGLWNLNNPVFKSIYLFFKKKELVFINRSAAIVSLTEAGKKDILAWKGVKIKADKISVIPCCVDTKLFDRDKIRPDEVQRMRQMINVDPEALVIGYLGSIGTWYLLDEMLQFFSLLKRSIPATKFLMVTHDDAGYITEKARLHQVGTDDLIIISAERQEVPLMISLFSYGLFFIKSSYSKTASSPTKQGELMAMGVPAICNDGIGDSSSVVERYRSGLVVNLPNFDSCIQQLVSGIRFNEKDIRKGALDYFSLDKGVNEYREIYVRITNSFPDDIY